MPNTKFVSHKETLAIRAAAESVGDTSVVVRWGYGINGMREGIELALLGPERIGAVGVR